MHALMPLILQSHMEGGEYTLSFSHPYYSSRVDCSAMQGSGALDWLQSFGFVMVAGVVPEQHQGQQPLEEQFTSLVPLPVCWTQTAPSETLTRQKQGL